MAIARMLAVAMRDTVEPGAPLGADHIYDIHTDQLNTPRMITDQNSNVVWQWDNVEPFGNGILNQSVNSSIVFNLRFAGQYYDLETGLHYNYFRDCYDPSTGRYCQSDPIGLYGGSASTYAYAKENPLNKTDPLGLATVVVVGGPSGANVAGHVAIGFTDQGVYSYGTSDAFGSSLTNYLANQASYRDSTVYVLDTTPEQEQQMIAYLNRNYTQRGKYSVLTHSCATAVNGALGVAGIGDDIASEIAQTGGVLPPQLPSTAGVLAGSFPGAQIISIPQGASIPIILQSFNPGAK